MIRGQQTSWAVWIGVLLPAIALLGLLAWVTLRHQQSIEISTALARGQAPPVPSVALRAFDGPPVSLPDLRGHPILVNFWASWCVPCAKEAPVLEAIWNEFRGRGLIVIGVDTQDLEQSARRFLVQHGVTYMNVRDPDGSFARLFGTTGVPETFFVGGDGRIRGKFPGEEPDRRVWWAAVRALLGGSQRVP